MNLLIVFLLLQAGTLEGRWDSESRSIDGLGIWIVLSADGTCTRTVGLMIDGRWKLDGDQLTVTTGPAGGEFVQTTTVSSTSDVLTQAANGVRRHRSRVGVPDAGVTSLIGVWSYPHPAGGTAYDEYAKDGRFLFRLPTATARCRWAASADRLSMTEGSQTQTVFWNVSSDRLTLREGVDQEVFRRERSVIPTVPGR